MTSSNNDNKLVTVYDSKIEELTICTQLVNKAKVDEEEFNISQESVTIVGLFNGVGYASLSIGMKIRPLSFKNGKTYEQLARAVAVDNAIAWRDSRTCPVNCIITDELDFAFLFGGCKMTGVIQIIKDYCSRECVMKAEIKVAGTPGVNPWGQRLPVDLGIDITGADGVVKRLPFLIATKDQFEVEAYGRLIPCRFVEELPAGSTLYQLKNAARQLIVFNWKCKVQTLGTRYILDQKIDYGLSIWGIVDLWTGFSAMCSELVDLAVTVPSSPIWKEADIPKVAERAFLVSYQGDVSIRSRRGMYSTRKTQIRYDIGDYTSSARVCSGAQPNTLCLPYLFPDCP